MLNNSNGKNQLLNIKNEEVIFHIQAKKKGLHGLSHPKLFSLMANVKWVSSDGPDL